MLLLLLVAMTAKCMHSCHVQDFLVTDHDILRTSAQYHCDTSGTSGGLDYVKALGSMEVMLGFVYLVRAKLESNLCSPLCLDQFSRFAYKNIFD
jgi:hypothetical protein